MPNYHIGRLDSAALAALSDRFDEATPVAPSFWSPARGPGRHCRKRSLSRQTQSCFASDSTKSVRWSACRSASTS